MSRRSWSRRKPAQPVPVRAEALTEALKAELGIERNNVELLTGQLIEAQRGRFSGELLESVADLTRSLYDPGWMRLTALTEQEFAPDALVQLRAICRLMAIKNSLIKRGLGLRAAYVWGQGVDITARANGTGHEGEQDVQQVVHQFLTDQGNQAAFTGPQARDQNEKALGHDGEVFAVLFTRPTTGEVSVRTILADEIAEVIANPEDRSEAWFYRRRWTVMDLDRTTGSTMPRQMEKLYPALGYRPRSRPSRFGHVDVAWDSPVLHIAVNSPLGWQRGIPDAYAAVDWARAYKIFLEDWATLVKALSRFAYRLTAKGSQVNQARTRLAKAPPRDPATGAAQDVGGTAIVPPEMQLDAIPKSGATIDADSGRPIAAMVAAALGVPVTMLLGDPGTTGARATAETLDRPTELEMGQRQQLWAAAFQQILRHVITESVRAPQGQLRGVITQDKWGRETVALAGDTSMVIDVHFPDLDEVDPATVVKAVVEANSTGTIPPDQILRMLLTALGVRDVDTLVEGMLDDNGVFQWPAGPPMGAGGPGSMTPGADDQTAAPQDAEADLDWGLFGQTGFTEDDDPDAAGALPAPGPAPPAAEPGSPSSPPTQQPPATPTEPAATAQPEPVDEDLEDEDDEYDTAAFQF